MTQQGWVCAALSLGIFLADAHAQLDPEKRRLIQLGYNQPMEGTSPIAAYGFYYYNRPGFIQTNMTLRLAIAPIYLDAELGFSGVLTPETDVSVGFSGGGFGDSYSEIRRGRYLKEESFLGHGAELSSSIYHRLNPDWRVPAWAIGRASVRHSIFHDDSDTADEFELPDNFTALNLRTGLRLGGREPSLTSPVAFEFSVWYQAMLRAHEDRYGFNNDRELQRASHLFWGRTLLKYTFDESQQFFDVGLTLGTSIEADRFSAYRLGGFLPFVSEFPLSIPGYLFQELSAEHFGLVNAEYSFPVSPSRNWRLNFYGAAAVVDFLNSHDQGNNWHGGVGSGITYVSPRGAWFVSLVYGYGFQAIRHGEHGASQIGVLFQYDFDAVRKFPYRRFDPNVNPYGSRGGERLFR